MEYLSDPPEAATTASNGVSEPPRRKPGKHVPMYEHEDIGPMLAADIRVLAAYIDSDNGSDPRVTAARSSLVRRFAADIEARLYDLYGVTSPAGDR